MNMKKKKINHKNNIETNNELINLIKIVVIVCVILLAFYFITLLVNKKTKGSVFGNDDSVAVIQYDKIIVGEILNRPDNNYLVLVKKENDVNSNLYQSYLSIYSGKENALKVYNVDLSEVFNSNYLGDETILDKGIQNYKFSDTTIIKVDDGSISESYVGTEAIENYLKELIK